jgi:hypothetical protein
MAVLTKPIDSLTATARGEVIDMGEAGISEHGFVYDSNASISANAQRVQLGKMDETGSFEATLINLRSNTRYFINSFLTSSNETTYGGPVSFRTAMNLPEVKTESMANITDSTATCNGDVTQDGGAVIFSRGVCWSTFSQPTLNNDHSVDGTGTGKFAGSLIHLKKDSTYFVRTYASNNAGTTYGNELSFKAGESQTSPYVTTAEITGIAQTAAVSGGEVVSEGGSPVTARGVCWSVNPYPSIDDYKTIDGSGPGQFGSSVTGLSANTTYYLRAYAINAIGISYGEEKTFQTISDPVIPTVTTTSITNITTTTAQSGGIVLESGGSVVTERGVCWSTSPDPTIADSKSNDGSGMGAFVSLISGLNPNQKYYIRAYAINAVGAAYGNEISFTSGQNITTPIVTTTEVVNILQITATCGGNVTADGGAAVTVRGVCWNTSPNPTTAYSKTMDGSGTGGYLSSLSGLFPNTIYYVRAYATNSVGTSYGNQKEFTTLSENTVPSLTTAPVINVTNSTATSGGTITNDGGANVTARGICWSTGFNPSITDPHTNDGIGTGSFISQITNLLPNTFYRVRAYATNSVGTSYGNQQTFSTLENPVLPTVSTAQAMNITTMTATSGGTVNSDGGSTVTVRGVCWSTSSNPTTANSHSIDGSGMGMFVSNLTSLTPNTLYYVRAYATNIVGTSYGNEISFTTLSNVILPTVTTDPATNITQTTATSGGNVTSDGGAAVTARGICYSTSPSPTLANSFTTNGTGTGAFISNLTGLTPNTPYYIRSYATNSVGTAYGNEVTLTTLPNPVLPTVTTAGITNITQTTATSGGDVTSDGGATVIARGVCWSTSSNPTTANSKTTDGSGTGVFVSNLTGLTASTLYYVRAYATNSAGTAYGNEVTFTTLSGGFTCGSSFTINHVAGAVAPVNKTVTYGTVTNIPGETTKCWITSNLGADHQASAVNDATEASAGWYWQFNRKQGYKHDGTTRTPNTTWIDYISEDFDWQIAKDPCSLELGSGWRLPAYSEWFNVDEGGNWTNWNGPWNSGLKLHAAGGLNGWDGSLGDRGSVGHYWSATQFWFLAYGWSLYLSTGSSQMDGDGVPKAAGYTLRCLKD